MVFIWFCFFTKFYNVLNGFYMTLNCFCKVVYGLSLAYGPPAPTCGVILLGVIWLYSALFCPTRPSSALLCIIGVCPSPVGSIQPYPALFNLIGRHCSAVFGFMLPYSALSGSTQSYAAPLGPTGLVGLVTVAKPNQTKPEPYQHHTANITKAAVP